MDNQNASKKDSSHSHDSHFSPNQGSHLNNPETDSSAVPFSSPSYSRATRSSASSPDVSTTIVQEPQRPPTVSIAPPEASQPYSVFTSNQKLGIVLLAACAGLFSTLAANIYFPAIPTLARSFRKTTQDINLTVTIYMIFQGVTPSLWGSFADIHGRRPIYISCLALFAGAQIVLAVIPSSSYSALMVLRCISAAGSAPLIALAAGTVGDIATPGERGRYMGWVQMGPSLGPCIGPVFGGLLNQKWGWRAIFWFLAILSFGLLIPCILFHPETLRSIVGNGSISATGLNRTAWSIVSRRWKTRAIVVDEKIIETTKYPRKEVNPLIGLRYMLEKDVAIVLLYNAFNYTAFYAVTTTLASVFEDTYGLSTSIIGVCYLAIGGGAFAATFTSGRILDREFRKTRMRNERQLLLHEHADVERGDEQRGGQQIDEIRIKGIVAKKMQTPLDPYQLLDFPLERTRLRHQPIYSLIFWSSTVANGWAVQAHAPLAVALILQFIIGWSIISIMQINQVMLVDFYPGKGASITANVRLSICVIAFTLVRTKLHNRAAQNNLFRCLIGAVGTAVVDPMKHTIGSGWTMTIFIAIPVMFSPLVVLERSRGMGWRNARAERIRRQAEDDKGKATSYSDAVQ